MNHFVTNIHINKLFHLKDFDIPVADGKCPHLIITGKNGSGKTVLLNAVLDYISAMHAPAVSGLDAAHDAVVVDVADRKVFDDDDFIVSFYQADRKVNMLAPSSPTKPVLEKDLDVRQKYTSQFLNFLSDLKIQEALARNESQLHDAEEIHSWFVSFEDLLRQIFQDEDLKLEFNYRDYSFKLCTEGKKFGFTELSDGFAAVLDIVADLILRMQDGHSLTRAYKKQGIVLIDEIETHLHLELQKIIMPLLTKLFPNIQFIVTTHSPFVLSSLPNAVAYDLEHREVVSDLTEYSYECLTEGYFRVKTQSSYSEMQLQRLRTLLSKDTLSGAESVEVRQLRSEFDKIAEVLSPQLVGEYRQILVDNAAKLRNL